MSKVITDANLSAPEALEEPGSSTYRASRSLRKRRSQTESQRFDTKVLASRIGIMSKQALARFKTVTSPVQQAFFDILDRACRKLLPASEIDSEIGQTLWSLRQYGMAVLLVSLFTNALMLTGPLYMLQIYDRVLASGSGQTLFALTILVIALYAGMGLFESIRSSMMSRVAAVFEIRHAGQVFNTNALLPIRLIGIKERPDPVRDLDQCRSTIASPAPLALFDLPWLPIYLGIVFLMHPLLGLLGTVGAGLLVVIMLLNDRSSRQVTKDTSAQIAARSAFANTVRSNPGAVMGMGMAAHLERLWFDRTKKLLELQTQSGDRAGLYSALTKSSRMFLQSAVLGLGALLAINEQITPGIMIAASIITARALAPVEQTIGGWRGLQSGWQAYKRLNAVLGLAASEPPEIAIPLPSKTLAVENLVSGPSPSSVIVKRADFSLSAGDGLGIIGPSGSGKTTLVRAMLGIWPTLSGSVRYDGLTIDQWERARFGKSVGYLPQDVEMFEGTIAANIARFDPEASVDAVMKAVTLAGVHDLIARLPDGYATELGEGKVQLSAGQRQRIGLARALYGDPFLVVLDEPNSNLDVEGDKLLAKAVQSVRERNGIAIIIAHRPSALASVDRLLVMKDGRQDDFGPKDEVMGRAVKNAPGIQTTAGLKVIWDGQ